MQVQPCIEEDEISEVNMRIAVDAMGGDNAPDCVVDAVVEVINNTDAGIILCGKESLLREKLSGRKYDEERLEIVDCDDVISDHDEPVKAVKQKKTASMVVCARLLAEGKADAMLSAGNTGALLASGLLIVGRIKGVMRPALATLLPTAKGGKLLIDAGANTNCKPQVLAQFGVMGSLYMKKLMGIENPGVGLVANGAEEEKGTALVKDAHMLLKEADLNFIGNIEGRDIMEGVADVMVTDGFTGNVILKTIEGMGAVINRNIKAIFKGNIINMLGALCVFGGLKRFKKSMDYREYGGAPILGLKKLVVKGHGSSDKKAILKALMLIVNSELSDVTDEISAAIDNMKELNEVEG